MLISIHLYNDAMFMYVFGYKTLYSVKIVKFPPHMRNDVRKLLEKLMETAPREISLYAWNFDLSDTIDACYPKFEML